MDKALEKVFTLNTTIVRYSETKNHEKAYKPSKSIDMVQLPIFYTCSGTHGKEISGCAIANIC